MDGLPLSAVMLLYPDGTIEKKLITDKDHHIDYFKELLLESPKFAKICSRCDYSSGLHTTVDLALAKANVVLLINFNLYEIANDRSSLDYDLPNFIGYLPHELGSLEQLEYLRFFYDNYPFNKVIFNRLIKKDAKKYEDFKEFNYEDVDGFIDSEKNRLEKENKEELERRN